MLCENCFLDHNGSYGSGRFCSCKCARGYSTKAKRKEINEKVSKSTRMSRVTRICEYKKCKKSFLIRENGKRKKRFCSIFCANKHKCSDPNYLKKLSNSLKGKTGGYRTKSGRSKFHGGYYKGIWMDSSWELLMAKRLDDIQVKWLRNSSRKFPYTTKNKLRRNYYPDFYLPEQDLYIEIKGYWTSDVRHKVADAQKRNSFNLLILESKEQIEKFLLA